MTQHTTRSRIRWRQALTGVIFGGILLPTIGAGSPPASPSAASPSQDSVLSKIEALNPHLKDEDIPYLSLKVHSLNRGPYDFFRGTTDLFYAWCKSHCRDWSEAQDTEVLLHGDVHPGNTGTYVAGPDGGPRLAYALVDFDEVFLGAFELDLLRAATSLRFAAAENKLTMSDEAWREIVGKLVASYCETWSPFHLTGDLQRGPTLLDANARVLESPLVMRLLAKADTEDATEYADKYTKGNPPERFKARRGKKKKPKDIMRPVSKETRAQIVAAFRASRMYADLVPSALESEIANAKVLDVVRWVRVGSSGSQGVRKYLVLLEPPSDPLARPSIFQLKEEPPPGAIRAGLASPIIDDAKRPATRSQLVASASIFLQARPKRFMGFTEFGGRSYLVKPKNAFGKEPDTEDLDSADALLEMADIMGRLLAIGHAKSQIKSDVTKLKAAIARGSLTDEILTQSDQCFTQFRQDYDAFRRDTRVSDLNAKAMAWVRNPG